jgi:hypothetical protein
LYSLPSVNGSQSSAKHVSSSRSRVVNNALGASSIGCRVPHQLYVF